MKKTTFVFLAISLISLKLFAQAEKTTQVRVGLLNGPTCVPAAYLMENKNTISSDGSEAELTFEKFALNVASYSSNFNTRYPGAKSVSGVKE